MNMQSPPLTPVPVDLADQIVETPLSDSEKSLRELFVNEYLKDFDPINAALRCGFAVVFAMQWGPMLLRDAYVQRRITELTRKPSGLTPAEQDAQDRALVENTLRRNMQTGSGPSQVTAAKAFNELKGWTKHDDSSNTVEALAALFKEFATKAPV